MITKAQKIRLGVFVTVAVIALLTVIGILVVPKLIETRDVYYIGFRDTSVTGLVEGGTVKYHGLTVGFVSHISIDPNDIRRVIVEISLDHGTPIKEDTQAEMALLGITGLKLIELAGGSNEAKPLKTGSIIEAGVSITDRLTDSAEAIALKAQRVMDNLSLLTDTENRRRIVDLLENTNNTLTELHSALTRNRSLIDTTIANAESISADAKDISRMTRHTMSKVESVAESDSLRLIMRNLVEITDSIKKADLVQLIQELNTTLERSNRMIRDLETSFTRSRSDILSTIESLKETSDYLNQFTRMLSEDPSVLVRGSKPKDAPDDKLGK
jgi:phospholipid/cholesterol/gamma-HCH transport system substrate-binding protein